MTLLPSGATIIPFPYRPGVVKRLLARGALGEVYEPDFAALWGFARAVVVDNEPGIDPYVCLYRDGESWSSWGIGYADGKYRPWHGATGRDLGEFETLNAAMQAIGAWRAPHCGQVMTKRASGSRRAVMSQAVPLAVVPLAVVPLGVLSK